MRKAVIFDIDGTMADCSHRTHLVPDWPAFFAELHNDAPIQSVIDMCRLYALSGEYDVLVVTARPVIYKLETQRWLQRYHIPYHQLYMRPADDWRQDVLVKADILQQIIDHGFDPYLAIDDRPEIVEMWRSFGIKCLQCESEEIKLDNDGKQFLDILIGPSGAGKTVYTSSNYDYHQVISSDQIRMELFGSQGADVQTPEHHKRVFSYAHALIKARLSNHLRTCFDATNLRQRDRMAALRIVPKGQLVRYILIDRPLQDKEKTRGWRPMELVLKHHRAFQADLDNILNVDNQSNVILIDKRTK